MKRLSRVLYLSGVVVVLVFFAAFAVFHAVEASGSSDVQAGRVLDRSEGERTVTNCSRRGSCRSTTYPTYTVIGEREDGTAWLVVGEGPFRAMGGERGEVEVTTSDLTGRVVALAGADDGWDRPVSGFAWFGFFALAFCSLLVVAYERARRTGRWAMGRFERLELLAIVPGSLIGLFGVAYVTVGNTWGLEVLTSSELESTFIADPFDYAIVQEDASVRGGGITVNETFTAGFTPHTVVGVDHLNDEVRTALASELDTFAIPLLREGRPNVTLGRVEFEIEHSSGNYVAIDCPDGLLSFPADIDEDDNFGGFVCFDPAAEGGTLMVFSGSSRFMELKARPGYQLADGTVIDPPAN